MAVEQTLSIIKPDAVSKNHIGEIVARFEKAGLKISDVILSINDRSVNSLEGLRVAIAQMVPNSKVKLRLVRDGKERSLEVTLGELSEKPNELFSGVNIGPVSDDVRRRNGLDSRVAGVVVTEVDENSVYAARLVAGMVIVEINQRLVTDVASAKRAVILPGVNLLRVNYRGVYGFVTVTVK